MRGVWRWSFVVQLAVLMGLLLGSASTGRAEEVGGLEHVGTDQQSERVQVLRFRTPALTGESQVRILLPDDYDPTGATRYPVLYLLHGAAGSSARWLAEGQVEAATADVPLIVVMPDGGLFGYYADWWNFGAGGAPMWETYHLDQLLPWVDANYRTIANRDGRALAGESMGGLGAMHYAATRPDLFTAAAAFSGAIDTNFLLAPPIVEVSTIAEGLHLPAAAFGLRLTDEVRWRAHNPVDLAENLDGLFLSFDVGTGRTGGPGGLGVDVVEMAMHVMNTTMHGRLDALGIDHRWSEGPGCHCWTDWQRHLRQFVPRLMDRFANPAPPPASFSYTSGEPSYSVWGWQVTIDRPAMELSRLADAGPGGFRLTGSGAASVTTAPVVAPGATVPATVTDATGTTAVTLVADEGGRLTVPVSLGAGNPYQELSPLGTAWALSTGAPLGSWPSVTAAVTFASPTAG